MDLTNPTPPSLEEAIGRYNAGLLTDTDTIQMLNTICAELERSHRLAKILTGAVMKRIEVQAAPAPVAANAAPAAQPVNETLGKLRAPMVVPPQVAPPVPATPAVQAPTPTQQQPEEAPTYTAKTVLETEGQIINFHSVALALASPASLAGGRGDTTFDVFNERIEPTSPDIVAILNSDSWPTGSYDGGKQTFIKLGTVAVLWDHENGLVGLNDRPNYAFSLPDGAGVNFALVTDPDIMRAIVMDIAAATQATLIANAKL